MYIYLFVCAYEFGHARMFCMEPSVQIPMIHPPHSHLTNPQPTPIRMGFDHWIEKKK